MKKQGSGSKVGVEDWYCKICEERSVEDMIQCLRCKQWVHETCAGVKPGKTIFSFRMLMIFSESKRLILFCYDQLVKEF